MWIVEDGPIPALLYTDDMVLLVGRINVEQGFGYWEPVAYGIVPLIQMAVQRIIYDVVTKSRQEGFAFHHLRGVSHDKGSACV